jgi:hypothetical protein
MASTFHPIANGAIKWQSDGWNHKWKPMVTNMFAYESPLVPLDHHFHQLITVCVIVVSNKIIFIKFSTIHCT